MFNEAYEKGGKELLEMKNKLVFLRFKQFFEFLNII